MSKFWKFKKLTNKTETETETITETENVLILNGVIAEDSWWGDEVTPQLFKKELEKASLALNKGDVEIPVEETDIICEKCGIGKI